MVASRPCIWHADKSSGLCLHVVVVIAVSPLGGRSIGTADHLQLTLVQLRGPTLHALNQLGRVVHRVVAQPQPCLGELLRKAHARQCSDLTGLGIHRVVLADLLQTALERQTALLARYVARIRCEGGQHRIGPTEVCGGIGSCLCSGLLEHEMDGEELGIQRIAVFRVDVYVLSF